MAKKKQPFLVDLTTPRYVSAERLEAGFVHDTVANCKIMRRERSSVYGEICVCIAKGEEHKQEPGTSRDSGTRRTELGDHDYFLDCRSDTHPTAGVPPRHGVQVAIYHTQVCTGYGITWKSLALRGGPATRGLCVCVSCVKCETSSRLSPFVDLPLLVRKGPAGPTCTRTTNLSTFFALAWDC